MTRAAAWAAALLAVVGLAAGAQANDTASEAPVVRDVRFYGASALSPAELEKQMITHEKSWRPWAKKPRLDESVLRADLDRVKGAYRAAGYYDARADYALTLSDDGESVEVEIAIFEGEAIVLRTFDVVVGPHPALSSDARATLRDGLALRPGAVFGSNAYRDARAQLLRRLADQGFPAASIEGGAEVVLASHTADVDWVVTPGPFVHFGDATVIGGVDVASKLVLRELTIGEGDVFSHAKLEESQAAIYNLGLFRSVALEPQPGVPTKTEDGAEVAVWPIVIRIEERTAQSVSVSVGYGTEDLFRARAGWQHRNFFGGARRLDASARYSSLLYSGDVNLLQPRLLDTNIDLELYGTARRETPPAYEADRFGVGATLRRRFGPWWHGRLGYHYEFNTRVELKSAVGQILPSESQLSAFDLGIRWERMDDLLEPTRGTWLDLAIEPSARAIGSDLDYVKMVAEAGGYYPVWRTVLAGRVRVGTLEPLGGAVQTDVPAVKRFYSGGSTSVRGYDYQSLGPVDANGNPLGGLTLIETSVEVRFPIWRRLSGVVFFDAGQLALDPFTIRGGDFQYSTGGGLRLSTPLGPLRLDYGRALNPPPGFPSGRVHFSVGQAF